jgi:UDP-glucose 4-epimerase
MKNILLTGASGYIASHTWIELLQQGYNVMGVDNFSNSNSVVLKRISSITGTDISSNFINADITSLHDVKNIFKQYSIDGVIHFAAHKAVGESVQQPLKYYYNNVYGLINLLQVMVECNVHNFVFSSSATVYGNPQTLPIKEHSPLSANNPYGQSKLMGENIIRDLHISNHKFKSVILRYFNPIGAHSSGLIGEDPQGLPNNIMPYISQVAVGRLNHLNIFGNDYPTIDGTGVRDYIHVVDLAIGHVRALDYLFKDKLNNNISLNLGTGIGYSVLQLVNAFSIASKKTIPYQFQARRDGDIASCYADSSLAKEIIGWSAKYDINHMCEDSWRWQFNNPQGYGII